MSKLQAIDGVMLYPLPTLEERLKVRKEIIGKKTTKKRKPVKTENNEKTLRRSTRSRKKVPQKLKF